MKDDGNRPHFGRSLRFVASYEADIAATSEINRSAASGDGLREATALSCFGF